MKTFVAALLIFAGLIGGNILLENRVVSDCRALDEMGENVIRHLRNGDNEAAKASLAELKQAFFGKEDLRLSISDHGKSEGMAVQLLEAEKRMEAKDFSGSEICLNTFCFLLQNYQENIRVKWQNIL